MFIGSGTVGGTFIGFLGAVSTFSGIAATVGTGFGCSDITGLGCSIVVSGTTGFLGIAVLVGSDLRY